MSIDLVVGGRLQGTKYFVFSGGEVQLELPPIDKSANLINVVSRIQSSDDLMQLILASEVLARNNQRAYKRLVLPYFPYARQDRIMKPNEAFSLKSFANIINSLKFDEVVTYDTHSSVTDALVDRITIIEQHEIVHRYLGLQEFIETSRPILIAPDAGAVKKAVKISNQIGTPLIVAHKTRDVLTGAVNIAGVSEIGLPANKDCLIVDDICDGGATFILLAKYLREQVGVGQIALYVTHGIFSKGYEVFKGLIDRIYITDTFIAKEYPLPNQVPVFTHKIQYEGYHANPNG